MADLILKGILDLQGVLTLEGKVKIGDAGLEALVQVTPGDPPHCSNAPPVVLPPPPAAPIPPDMRVWIVNSFNQTVMVKTAAGPKALVTQGMVMQGGGGAPMWPGMVLPSAGNPGVTVNMIPVNVQQDQAVIFPSGASAVLGTSGQ